MTEIVVGLVAFCIGLAAVVIAIDRIVTLVGDVMSRIVSAAVVGVPLSYPTHSGGRASVPTTSGPTLATEEPALPELESAIGRLADFLQQQFREQGSPISREEAVAQARLMMVSG